MYHSMADMADSQQVVEIVPATLRSHLDVVNVLHPALTAGIANRFAHSTTPPQNRVPILFQDPVLRRFLGTTGLRATAGLQTCTRF